MQDKTTIGNNENAQAPSKAFREYIESLVQEIVVNKAVFNDHKKYLQRYSEEEGLDYAELEKNLTDFFEVIEEWKKQKSKSSQLAAKMLGKDCYLEESKVDELLAAVNEAREKETERIAAEKKVEEEQIAREKAERKAREERKRKAKEEEERMRREKERKETKQREKERLEAENKAKEAAEHQERMKEAEDLFQQWANFAKTGVNNKQAEECLHFLMESAALGYPKAQNHLALLYDYGWGGVKQNSKEAFRLSMASALQGNRGGLCRVGMSYLYGFGVKPNDELAFSWLSKSAQAGSSQGMVYLAICYRYGIGTARNLEQAEQLISKAKEISPQRASFFSRITNDNTFEHIELVRSKKA